MTQGPAPSCILLPIPGPTPRRTFGEATSPRPAPASSAGCTGRLASMTSSGSGGANLKSSSKQRNNVSASKRLSVISGQATSFRRRAIHIQRPTGVTGEHGGKPTWVSEDSRGTVRPALIRQGSLEGVLRQAVSPAGHNSETGSDPELLGSASETDAPPCDMPIAASTRDA